MFARLFCSGEKRRAHITTKNQALSPHRRRYTCASTNIHKTAATDKENMYPTYAEDSQWGSGDRGGSLAQLHPLIARMEEEKKEKGEGNMYLDIEPVPG